MASAPRRGPAQPSPTLTAAMSGAVDLAAVKARSDAAARAAEAPPPEAGQFVVDVTEQSFEADVLDRSFQLPVLLSVWSARVPGSEALNAPLEQIVTESGGAYVLAKLDVEANVRVAQALGLQGLPALFAVLKGELVPGFEGVLPEAQLREFVAAIGQAAVAAGMPGAVTDPSAVPGGQTADGPSTAHEPPEDPRFDAAEDALADGDYALAHQRYEQILAEEPSNADATVGLRQSELLGRLAATDGGNVAAAPVEPAADDLPGQLRAADLQFAGGDGAGAIRRLLDSVPRLGADDRDTVRQRLLDYFELLGPDDPLVAPARRELARALF